MRICKVNGIKEGTWKKKILLASDLLSWSLFGSHLGCLSSLLSCLDRSPFCTLWWLYRDGLPGRQLKNKGFVFNVGSWRKPESLFSAEPTAGVFYFPGTPSRLILQLLLSLLHLRHCHLQIKIKKMGSFKSNENIHKKEDGSYYVVSTNKASSVTL